MKAILNDTVIAEADRDSLVRIEGNWYFPPESIVPDALAVSPTDYHCPWKGDAQYFDARAGGSTHADAAWSPDPLPGASERVGENFAGYVAFDPSVDITE
ncbi:DUF427 domain-containing protein [Demequina sp. NBRC 110055]|uniref:DUF427 domain-containing protein n=1 Tax=Demequina sp. NBRC 110055 TaxID=1570344 RepID=UPI000A02B8FF|nr:DUF427 domain-containing protein [Demequina sp. NBRC 110055]